MRGAAIMLRDLTIAYERHPAVHHLTGNFAPGSLTAIVGPNGAGKSTLLKAITGALRPAAGTVDLNGLSRSDLAYLPQQAEIDRAFPITVADTVVMGAWTRIGVGLGVDRATAVRAGQALSAVGLNGFGRRPVGSLSAGQFQRVLFAAPGCARRPARRAVHRHRRADHARPPRSRRALAPTGGTDGHRGAA